MEVTVEADESGSGNDREGIPVSAHDGDDGDDVKREEDSVAESAKGYSLKKDEGWSDRNVPGDNTAQAKEEESGNVAANTEGLDEASEGGKQGCAGGARQGHWKEEEGCGNEGKSSSTNMKAGNNDDVNDGEDFCRWEGGLCGCEGAGKQ
ncbi:hypothetical protein DUI87_09589 [Hirundo rustica rustica]|uniref:Uncharacterized protein n=1 Tax=Hirundo rustica rustica TaxID=333673 RepID=A0A3M0KN64_HIRRU|nr:hypothetical protein DUI87_09589 [Hirundo rustica rustica]